MSQKYPDSQLKVVVLAYYQTYCLKHVAFGEERGLVFLKVITHGELNKNAKFTHILHSLNIIENKKIKLIIIYYSSMEN